jgi:hypothetical protein
MVLTTSTETTPGESPESAVSSVAFGIDELAALATLFGASRFPGVPEAPFAALTPQARDAAQRAARRGLVARGVIGFAPDGSPTLASGYEMLVGTPLTAELVVAVERRDAGSTRARHFYARPDSAVEHGVAVGNVHRLTLLDPADLAARIFQFTELEKRSGVDAPAFSTTAAAFAALREGVRNGDLAEARERLGADGSAFAAAMSDFRAWCTVRVLRRRSGTVEGGQTTWIDAGDAVWRVAARGEAVDVQPISAVGIVDEVLGNLTGGA